MKLDKIDQLVLAGGLTAVDPTGLALFALTMAALVSWMLWEIDQALKRGIPAEDNEEDLWKPKTLD